jgi:hypothetical protein
VEKEYISPYMYNLYNRNCSEETLLYLTHNGITACLFLLLSKLCHVEYAMAYDILSEQDIVDKFIGMFSFLVNTLGVKVLDREQINVLT